MTLYRLKPRFQDLLRPLVRRLARAGITANQVTIAGAAGSLGLGAFLSLYPETRWLFALLPLWLGARMALNAIDGMLAREHDQASRLGAYLNELGDVVSDAALLLPLAFVPPFSGFWVATVIFLLTLSEFAGVLTQAQGAARRYDGPLGKSDRALALGLLGLWIAGASELPAAAAWLLPLIGVGLVATIVRRLAAGLEAQETRT
ncbi:MAG: CDP-alcohol phosphatidyltransferase family protein [Alphaproteobacteria bacterium]|jgi:CDP-diacylglycerol--glycerol-3-phosphate 3-phosphatidyltransferase|nr:CDP-alcohol phosphatidyltransferase family protein [Alphaproteobacteria bacterium]